MRRSMIHGRRGKQSGFTLLEVLLAFVVFALSFAVILEILAGSTRSTVRARDYSEAALLAQSLIDMVGTDIPLEEGNVGGESPGGIDWVMNISTYQPMFEDDRTPEIAELTGTRLFWIDLDLEWGAERNVRQVHFSTVRSVLAGQEP